MKIITYKHDKFDEYIMLKAVRHVFVEVVVVAVNLHEAFLRFEPAVSLVSQPETKRFLQYDFKMQLSARIGEVLDRCLFTLRECGMFTEFEVSSMSHTWTLKCGERSHIMFNFKEVTLASKATVGMIQDAFLRNQRQRLNDDGGRS